MIKAIIVQDNISYAMMGITEFRIVIPIDYRKSFSNEILDQSSIDLKGEFAEEAELKISNACFAKEKNLVKNIVIGLMRDGNIEEAIEKLGALTAMLRIEVAYQK